MSGDRAAILRHAGAALLGQWAVMAFGVADTVVAGRHGDASLAALSVGSALFVSVYVSLMGLFQALLPIWAEFWGAGRPGRIGPSVQQAVWLAGLVCLPGMAVLWWPDPLLEAAGVPAEALQAAKAYLSVLAWGLPGALLFRIFGTLNQSMGLPRKVTAIQLAGLCIKVPLTVALALGVGEQPGMGAVGCAWATVLTNHAMLVLAVLRLRRDPCYRPLALWIRWHRPDLKVLWSFLRLGGPAALAVLVEVTSFTLMAVFVAAQGTTASAAHQIAANMAAVLYMVPLSLAIATSARVAYWRGAGQEDRARAAAGTGLGLALFIALCLASALAGGRSVWVGLYTDSPGVTAIATPLLAWVALFHLADGLQALCVFILRCYRQSLGPLVVYCVLLWGLGLGGGIVLSRNAWAVETAGSGAAVFWATAALALWIAAAILAVMLRQRLRPAGEKRASARPES